MNRKKRAFRVCRMAKTFTFLLCFFFLTAAGIFEDDSNLVESNESCRQDFTNENTKKKTTLPMAYMLNETEELMPEETKKTVLSIKKRMEEKAVKELAEKLPEEKISTESIAREVLQKSQEDSLVLMSSEESFFENKIMIYAGDVPMLITDEEKEILLRIVEAEATCEDVMGRMLVANVVLNRVLCRNFPNSIKEVVFQQLNGKYQFSPLSDKRYYKVKISEKTKEAVERVLNGEDESQGALFFAARAMANKNSMSWFDTALKKLFRHGVHEFFTVK